MLFTRKSGLKTSLTLVSTLIALFTLASCGPKAFTKGDYDDVEKSNLLNDTWSETDMQKAVKDLVDSLVASPVVAEAKRPPVVLVTNLQNKTSEHIDTQNIMDMVRVELTNRGKVSFVDKEARGDLSDEYQYQAGNASAETRKGPGGQTGADFVLNGRLDSIVQEVGRDKTVYYKLTLNLTNLKTSVISWTNYKQMRKKFSKQRVSM